MNRNLLSSFTFRKGSLLLNFGIMLGFCFMLTSYVAMAQISVKGTVLDEAGQSMPGVNITVKGTVVGVVTDVNGQFTLNVPNAESVLVFSFVGYITQEQAVGAQRDFSIVLIEDVKQIGEVVVVGYGVQKKETVVGAVSTVRGDELLKSPAANLSHTLTGRLSGVVTMQRSGEPGYDDATIRIRGSNTLGNNDPLVVIDGVADRAGGLSRLDPNEIESMSVLKDASAAIYGARAANGVILITTKSGKIGARKPEITYAFNYGWSRPTVLPEMSDAAEYAQLRNELIINDAAKNPASGEVPGPITLWKTEEEIQKYRDGSDPWRYPNTDWFKETWKPWSPRTNHSLTLNGGTDNIAYFANFGYLYSDGMYHNSGNDYKQYNLRINLDANINKWMKLGVGILGRQENRRFPSQGAGDILWFTSRGRPTDPAYWPNGKPGPAQEYGRNPVVAVTDQTGYDKDNRYYIQTNAKLEVTQPWIEGLKFTATISYDKYLQQRKRWFQPWYLYSWDGVSLEADGVTPKLSQDLSYPSSPDPTLNMYSDDRKNMVLGGIFSYDRTFGVHGVNIVAGVEKDKSDDQYFDAYRRYYLSTSVQTFKAGGDKEKSNDSGDWSKNWERARMNYFGRIAYNFKEKYLAEFVWRYDASYMFPEDTRYGFFPGFLLGYRISEEDFWKDNLSFIQYFKIRGSFGQLGNDQVWYDSRLQEYQYLSTFYYEWGYIIDNEDVKGLRASRFPNPNITWEVANNFNIGVEGRTFDNRLYFEVDYFFNRRSKILWKRNASIPQTAGLTLPAENIGKVDNTGFDFKIEWNDRVGSDFRYNITLSAGYAVNKIKYWDEAPGAPEWQKSTGMPMSTDIYYEFDGVFQNWDEINDKANRPNYDGVTSDAGLQPGDMKFKDIGGPDGDPDGKITPDDRRRFAKNQDPRWNAGLNMYFQWKGFDLSLLFQGSAYSWTKLYWDSGEIGNYLKQVYDNHWSEANQISDHPRVHARGKYYWDSGTGANNTYWMNNTDYIRLKNLEFGWTLPRNWMDKTQFFSNARVYLNGMNLFTITNAQALDPESTSVTGTNYPQAKIINVGFSLTF